MSATGGLVVTDMEKLDKPLEVLQLLVSVDADCLADNVPRVVVVTSVPGAVETFWIATFGRCAYRASMYRAIDIAQVTSQLRSVAFATPRRRVSMPPRQFD